jgi:hypothetical protein
MRYRCWKLLQSIPFIDISLDRRPLSCCLNAARLLRRFLCSVAPSHSIVQHAVCTAMRMLFFAFRGSPRMTGERSLLRSLRDRPLSALLLRLLVRDRDRRSLDLRLRGGENFLGDASGNVKPLLASVQLNHTRPSVNVSPCPLLRHCSI